MQAQFLVLMCLSRGESVITETILETRFMHVPELQRMGASVALRGNTAVVQGVNKLYGASVMATDLLASASLIIAGLVAEDETEVRRVYHLNRGLRAHGGRAPPSGAASAGSRGRRRSASSTGRWRRWRGQQEIEPDEGAELLRRGPANPSSP